MRGQLTPNYPGLVSAPPTVPCATPLPTRKHRWFGSGCVRHLCGCVQRPKMSFKKQIWA